MKIKNPMQLKTLLKNIAKAKGISPQLVLQGFFMERLLDRIARSKYKNNFILKGGFLIAATVGIEARTTMDIDTTVKGIELTHENIKGIFIEICSIHVGDDFVFSINRMTDIRNEDDYPGIRLHLLVSYHSIKGWLAVDVTTGDEITPEEIEINITTILGDIKIPVLAYNFETILAEKIETILSRGIANTRLRDFYDVYIFITEKKDDIDFDMLRRAITATSSRRGSAEVIDNYKSVLERIRYDSEMIFRWENYRSLYNYTKDISFTEVCDYVEKLMGMIGEREG